ncbi:MAG: hypothetical protein KAY78_04545 [Pseudomonadales bacterium]|nr:hypothetical protein [Cellvibrionales bacterium]MBP8030416.1 hypothetical protein [Pseudomonadales bacterium]
MDTVLEATMNQNNGHTTLEDQQDDVGEDEADLEERQWLAARGQKMAVYSILLNFVMRSAERSGALTGWLLEAAYLAVALFAVAAVLKMCSGLDKSQNQKILFMVLSFVPLVNLGILIYLSIKTTRMLRDAGWTVGLFGAKP